MSILFMDGFDHYGSGTNGVNNMVGGPWTSTSPGNLNIAAPSWGPARTGSFAVNNFSAGNGPRHILPSAKAQVFISMGFAIDGIPPVNGTVSVCSFRDASNLVLARLFCQSTGALALADSTGAIVATSAGPVVVARNWHFFEILFDRTNGTFTVRVDDATGTGTPVFNVTGLTFSSDCSQISVVDILAGGSSTPAWSDDVIIRDTSGSVNNGWIGDRRVATLFANQDTLTSGWSPSYYHEFGTGILRLAFRIAGANGDQNPAAFVSTVASPQLDIGNADFTLESEVRFDALPSGTGYATIFNRWDTTGDKRSYRLIYGGPSFNNSCLQFDISTDGTNSTAITRIQYPWSPQEDTWYHIALCRSAGQLLLFVDGVQMGLPITDSATYFSGGTETFVVGAQNVGTGFVANSYLCGRLDETRFTNGVGRYTATFTPPSAPFPRGVSDPNWANVVLLMGYDTAINDESSFTRPMSANRGAISFTPSDGPDVGVFSTINKAIPDDNTFISASYKFASNILTMLTNPANGDTITLGTKDGTVPAVYTFKTTMTTAFDVKIVTGAPLTTLANFLNAVNAGAGSGTAYFAGTTANFNVNAVALPGGQLQVFANVAGTTGNSIVSTKTGTAASWNSTTLTGGANIPGPSAFKLQRPPNNTTIISALQINARALKTDAGLASIQSSLIGGVGAKTDGAVNPLTTSVNYYADVFQSDPDTGGPISPTTIINGSVQINRTI